MDKRKITKLSFYDFDGTMCHSPIPETGVHQWAEHYGKPYPHVGWWSKEESLDMNAFDIQTVDFVKKAWEADTHNEHCATFLLTSRLYKLKPNVMKVLEKNGITFDGYFFKHFGKEKPDVVMEVLNQFPNVKEIHVWDDRDKEIILYRKAKRQFEEMGIDFVIHVVQA